MKLSTQELQSLAAMNARVYAMSEQDRERWYRDHPLSDYEEAVEVTGDGDGGNRSETQPALDPGLAAVRAPSRETGPSSRPGRAQRGAPAGIQPDAPAVLGRNAAAGAEGHPGPSLPGRAASAGRDGRGGSTEERAAQRDTWRRARSAQAKANRNRGMTYTPRSQRTAGSQYRPGMGVRRPQEPRGDGAG